MVWNAEQWRQGYIIKAVTFPEAERNEGIESYLVISHDCDIARGHSIEPFLELLPCHLDDVPDNSIRFAANPRKLQLSYEVQGQKLYFSLHAHEKKFISKICIMNPPALLGRLPNDQHDILTTWLAARYRRQALPDDLNASLTPFREIFEKRMKNQNIEDVLIGIWLTIEPSDQLDKNTIEPYECKFFFVYDIEKDPKGEKTDALIATLKEAISKMQTKTPPIEARFIPLAENNMTLWAQRRSIQWNFDHISNRRDGLSNNNI